MKRNFLGARLCFCSIALFGIGLQSCTESGGQHPNSPGRTASDSVPSLLRAGDGKTEIQPSAQTPAMPRLFEAEGLWGYRDSEGRVIIEPRYLLAQPFSALGLAAVVDERGWVYLDRRGNSLLRPFIFDNGPDPFREGLARYVAEKKIGYFDGFGKIVIPAQFDFGLPFRGGTARVCNGCRRVSDGEHGTLEGGRWWQINREGVRLDKP